MATEPSHPDTEQISRTENITHPRDYQLVELPEIAAVPAALTSRGSTEHFTVSYDNSLGSVGQTIADAVLAVCEADYSALQRDFGGVTPGNLPFNVNILPGNFGASHDNCAATTLRIGAQSASGVNIPFMRSLVIAEEDEVFEAAIGRGWDCGASNGEGLSRVLANDMYPGAEPSNFVSAPVWLDGGRPDFVNITDPTDQNYLSIGCAVLFLNWLHYQLNFNWNQIILAGAPTLAQTYTNLTGRTDAWTRFTILLRSHFPAGKPSGLTTDNPFPLTLPPQFAQNTPIAALTRNPNQMDLFAVGLERGVWSTWWDGQWQDIFRVGSAVFSQNTPIAALTRNPNQMDLFAVGLDGGVYSAWWDGQWHDEPWFRVGSAVFAQNTPIAALTRNPNQMDLFAVGLDGGVWSTWWNPNDGWTGNHDWFRVGSAVFAQNTPIAALTRNPNQMDLFAVGLDGGVYSAWWGFNQWHDWFSVI